MKATIVRYVVLAALSVLSIPDSVSALEYPGTHPGPSNVSAEGKELRAGNRVLLARWAVSESGLNPGTFTDLQSGSTLTLSGDLFQIATADGNVYRATALTLLGPPAVKERAIQPESACLAGRTAGWQVEVSMVSGDGRLRVVWLRDIVGRVELCAAGD